jgi:azurin
MLNFLPDFPCIFPRISYRNAGKLLVPWVCFLLFAGSSASAKDIPVTGILVYGTSGNLAYVQVTGFLINGKTELRACGGTGGIDKSAYKNLTKINLDGVTTLERLPNGSLVAEMNGAPPACVVPGNFKYDKDVALTASDLAEKSTYTGQVTGSSSPSQTAFPAFAPGVKFVFGSPTDKELAEYSLADRAQSIAAWQNYLSQYPSGAHLSQAKMGLSALLLIDGNNKLGQFVATRSSASPAYDMLKAARERADQALELQAGNDAAIKLRDAVRAELKLLSDSATAKLQAFRDATTAHVPGYPLLVSAKDLSDHISGVDPKYAPGMALAGFVAGESLALDQVVQTASSQIAAQQPDAAYATITKYLSFAGEEPRLKQIVAAAYKYHLDKGNAEVAASDWAAAVADFKRANEITATDESKTGLANAQASLVATQNKQAADKALAISKQDMDDKDVIGAYEVLANLSDAQRLLVKDDMAALEDAYVQAATAQATQLQLAHTPIRGRADEDAVRQAYDYLQRANKLSDNPEIGLKLELMAGTIADYYVGIANKYLSKPLSSGVGLGWAYLNEALQYRPNLDAIRDAMTSNTAAYQMRSRLSIGVVFRDQTSYRDSAHFADQLQQAFATDLETSGLPVKVVLPGATNTLQPNFQFVGDIMEHRPDLTRKKETVESKYRSGTSEIPNDAWNKADAVYENALLNLQKAQGALTVAEAKNNKKLVESSNADVNAAQEAVQEARSKMNAIPKNLNQDLVNPYNYTKTTLVITNPIELSLRLLDSLDNPVGEPIHVIKGKEPKTFIILDDIKPDDTMGVKQIDTEPNQIQLMTDVEIDARDTIVKAALDRVKELPKKIIAQARDKVANNDLDGAAEAYVLYLNCTPAAATPERLEATRFLSENFNIRNTSDLRATAQ